MSASYPPVPVADDPYGKIGRSPTRDSGSGQSKQTWARVWPGYRPRQASRPLDLEVCGRRVRFDQRGRVSPNNRSSDRRQRHGCRYVDAPISIACYLRREAALLALSRASRWSPQGVPSGAAGSRPRAWRRIGGPCSQSRPPRRVPATWFVVKHRPATSIASPRSSRDS